MRVCCDIEANGLHSPTQIWLIVCYDIDSKQYHIFRNVTSDTKERERFREFSQAVSLWIGHNFLDYDYPVMHDLLGLDIQDPGSNVLDTLILSKLIDYPREGHSLADYGLEFDLLKGDYSDWSKYTPEMETYCIRDVDITYKIYTKYYKYLSNPLHRQSILVEHKFQLVVNEMHTNGFSFNVDKASKLLLKVQGELDVLDQEIATAFPRRLRPIREITPRATQHGTLNRSDFRFVKDGDLSGYNVGAPFTLCSWIEFNPSSHKQIVDTLHEAGWSPTDKTKTHIDLERRQHKVKYTDSTTKELDLAEISVRLKGLEKYGWKINEANLHTLPPSAPAPARTLAKRILLESRRRTLTEWLGLVRSDTGRIHGTFAGIGAWTHRMSHQKPNTANIPNDLTLDNKVKLYGKEMRSCWQAPPGRLLVGVDAEGIQLRIFAHYINDPEFTQALVDGKKEDKSDPHSLNQRILGSVCKSRAAAKRFVFALLLGAGIGKLQEILSCTREEADAALGRLLERYTGFAHLKASIIPADAKRGWFTGLDGRRVRILGETVSQRKHLAMSGYLQNGEAVVMKHATVRFYDQLVHNEAMLVDLVHDEWQTEVPDNMEIALHVAKIQADSLREVGEELGLRCPLAGSYWNDEKKTYTVGQNWYVTH